MGRFGTANIQAWQSDQKAAAGLGVAIYPSHDLHMLAFAASMDGQGAVAVQAAKDYTKFDTNMLHILTLVRFGRFDDIQELNKRPENNDIAAAVWDFGQGYARLRAGEKDFARADLNPSAQPPTRRRRCSACTALMICWVFWRPCWTERSNGRREVSTGNFGFHPRGSAIRRVDVRRAGTFALFATALAWGRLAGGPAVCRGRTCVSRRPQEASAQWLWSLFGLKTALESQGKRSPKVEKDFDASRLVGTRGFTRHGSKPPHQQQVTCGPEWLRQPAESRVAVVS